MDDQETLAGLVAALALTHDHLIGAAADAIIDGEWDSATEITQAARVVNRLLRYRQDELGDYA